MKQLTNLSFSQINAFQLCPKSWYVQKILGEEQPPSDMARRGNQVDQLIACRLGCGAELGEPALDRVEEAVEFYLNNGGWGRADEAQRKIEITPNAWDILRDVHGVDYTLPVTLIGYIDLYRRAENGIQVEIADIKTSERAEFRPSWSLQLGLYALVERAVKWQVHLLTFTKQIKLVRYEYRPTNNTFAWVMNVVGEAANRMLQTSRETCLEKIPATPGYQCRWCPRQLSCEAALCGSLTACND